MKKYNLPSKWHAEDDSILTSNWGILDPVEVAELIFQARQKRAKERVGDGGHAMQCPCCGEIMVPSCSGGTVVLRAAALKLITTDGIDELAARWYREHKKRHPRTRVTKANHPKAGPLDLIIRKVLFDRPGQGKP